MATRTGIAARRIAESVRDLIREEVPVEEEKYASDEAVSALAREIKIALDVAISESRKKPKVKK